MVRKSMRCLFWISEGHLFPLDVQKGLSASLRALSGSDCFMFLSSAHTYEPI